MNPHLRLDHRPEPNDTALVCAFTGWNDGGEAASVAARYLAERWRARRIGEIDPEEFYDFQVNRPSVHLVEGVSRQVDWPAPELLAASGGGRTVAFVLAAEPNNRWRSFARAVVDAAAELEAGLLLTLGGFLADVAFSHPVPVVGTARDAGEAARLGLATSTYEGPTGITGVVHDAANDAGLASISLWAAVPHYLPVAPNPKAALALVERTAALLGRPVQTARLEAAVRRWERGVARLLEGNEELSEYVERLESAAEDRERAEREESSGGFALPGGALPSGDSIADELERYLREQAGGDTGPAG